MKTEHERKEPEHLPACVTEFIGLLLKKMRYRRKVRAEVEAEIAAHFADELRHSAEDAEKVDKAKQLVTEFGDIEMLAALLRRAKRRCRPLWRTMIARTLQATGALILCLVIYLAWFFSGKPAVTTDYVAELNRSVRPAADESLNAAPFYDKALELAGDLSDDFLIYFSQNHQAIADTENQSSVEILSELAEQVNGMLSPTQQGDSPEQRQGTQKSVYSTISDHLARLGRRSNELTPGQMSFVKRWVAEHHEALELVAEGAMKPHWWRQYECSDETAGSMLGVRVPNLVEFRGLGRTLRWRALLSADRGRHGDALDDLGTLYRFAEHVRRRKLLVEQLVGVSLEALAVKSVREIVGNYEVDSKVLGDFQRDLERIVADQDFSISLNAVKLCVYDEIQRCFTSGGPGEGHLYLPRFREISSYTASSYTPSSGIESFLMEIGQCGRYFSIFGHPNKQETLATTRALYAYYDELLSKTAVERHAEGKAIDHKLRSFVKGNRLLNEFTPAIMRIVEIGNRLPTDVAATLAIVGISRYKADKGRYPQDLNQMLTEGYLAKLPIDTFTDRPLVYKRGGDNYILYSVGPNFKDDGGTPGTDSKGRPKQWIDSGDTVFWPLPAHQLKLR